MARAFDGVDDYIDVAAGTATAGFGARTCAAIVRSTANAGTIITGAVGLAAGDRQWVLQLDTAKLLFAVINPVFGSRTSVATLTLNEWYFVAVTKAALATVPRLHIYRYSDNTWVHEDGTGSATVADSGTVSRYLIGTEIPDATVWAGSIAIVGLWDQNFADAEVERLPFSEHDWYALAAQTVWPLDQSATTQPVADHAGAGANQTNLIGTTVSTNSVPVFNVGGLVKVTTQPAAGSTPVSASDTPTVSLTESTSILVTVSASDTTTVSLTEAQTSNLSVSVSDTTTVSLTEAVSTTAAITGADTPTVSATETAAVAVAQSATDTTTVSLTETTSTGITVSASDVPTLAVTEAQTSNIAVSVTDTTTVAATESTDLLIPKSAADTPTLTLADLATLAVAQTAADAVSLTVADLAAIAAGIAGSELVSVGVTDAGSVVSSDVQGQAAWRRFDSSSASTSVDHTTTTTTGRFEPRQ